MKSEKVKKDKELTLDSNNARMIDINRIKGQLQIFFHFYTIQILRNYFYCLKLEKIENGVFLRKKIRKKKKKFFFRNVLKNSKTMFSMPYENFVT